VDAGGAIVGWNRACEELAASPPGAWRGKTLDEVIELDDGGGWAALAGERKDDFSGQAKCADGRRVPVRITVTPHSLDQGQQDLYSIIVIPRASQAPSRYGLLQDLPIADIIEGLPCVFYIIDQTGHLLLWNHQLEDALEMRGEELPVHGVNEFFQASTWPGIQQKIQEAFELGISSHEAELIGQRGKRTTFLFHCARTSLGGLPCVFGTGLDISARKTTEQALRIRERAIYSSVNAIVITCCDQGEHRIEYVNPAFEQLTGYVLGEIKGRDPRFMRIEGCDVAEHARIREALKRKQSVRAILRNAKKNGEMFWNDLRIDPVSNSDGEVTHFVAVINDITSARHYERRLHHLAHHDPLTGLANRTLLHERLKSAIGHAVRNKTNGALAFIDLDNFKHINDSFGHETGDIVLLEIARRVRENMRGDDTVARVGGDEFVVLVTGQPSYEHVADLVERMRASIGAPIAAAGQEIVCGASIGVSVFPRDGDNVDRIMRAADAAMYHAKALGKNNCQFYSPALNQAVHQRLLLEASLSAAIQHSQLVLGYQPKIDVRTAQVVGAEALVRWNHPERGLIPPDKFIPIAEETGLIVPLGEWVLGEACGALKTLQSLGFQDFVISVNLSARQLRHRHFAALLGETLQRHGVPPQMLELEVTESQLMDNPAEAMEVLAELKALGVRLSIDDFGTGYSSLSHLQKFPVDYIKIDRSFLREIGGGDAVITRAIVALGHNLKLKVIAEGVETKEQLTFLRDLGCDQVQGFYFSPALPCELLQDLVCSGGRQFE
jgi:diguanylate cyclase (GGDEF)-like protein/PAS domain S-box-containing protein